MEINNSTQSPAGEITLSIGQHFGQLIKEFQKQKGIKSAEMAGRLKVPQKNYENNLYAPNPTTNRLIEYLGEIGFEVVVREKRV
jgi:transcriptional regulator with XRE-family HTH domain